MKYKLLTILTLLMLVNQTLGAETSIDSEAHKIHHVVIVWLKQHGDSTVQQQYINASLAFAELPGVEQYTVGTPAAIQRERINPALDESYDLAITSTYRSQQDYERFLKHPDYVKVAQEVLKPLVEKYKIYDFVE